MADQQDQAEAQLDLLMVRILVDQQTKTVAIMEILVILANQMEIRTISQNLRLVQTMTQLFPQTMAVSLIVSLTTNSLLVQQVNQASKIRELILLILLSKHRLNLFYQPTRLLSN